MITYEEYYKMSEIIELLKKVAKTTKDLTTIKPKKEEPMSNKK